MKTVWSSCFAYVVAAAVTLLTVVQAAPGQVAGRELFEPLPATAVLARSSDGPILAAETVRERLVSIDLGLLDQARRAASFQAGRGPSPGALLGLNLFDDVALTAVIDHTAPTLSGGYSLSGGIVGEPHGDVVLVARGDEVVGKVRTSRGSWRIESFGGVVAVSEVRDAPFECQVSSSGGADVDPLHFVGTHSPAFVAGAAEDPPPVVDVAVFWTAEVCGAVCARPPPYRPYWVEFMVAYANRALRESGANVRVRLVGGQRVVAQQSSNTADLAHFAGDGDGWMDEVHEIRRQTRADVMILMVKHNGGGLAQVGTGANRAFAVVGMSTHEAVFIHELGHVLGQLKHDRYSHACGGRSCTGANYGYVNPTLFEAGAPDTAHWETIMATGVRCRHANTWCKSLLRFSNPELLWEGEAMGVPASHTGTGLVGPAHAVLALNARASTVANFLITPSIDASFGADSAEATEGGAGATVTVTLSAQPQRSISIPLAAPAGPRALEYELPATVDFGATDTSKTFTVTAVDDAIDEEDESVEVTFGTDQPSGVTATGSVTVTLKDNDTISGAAAVLSIGLPHEAPGLRGAGDTIEATVLFNKHVKVTGRPRLGFTVGDEVRWASHVAAMDESLRFRYVVSAGDFDSDGVGFAAGSIDLNGGTILDVGDTAVDVSHGAFAPDVAVRVDGVRPVLEAASIDGDVLTLTFDEELDASSLPRGRQFVVRTRALTYVEGGRAVGRKVEIRVRPPVSAGVAVGFAYRAELGAPRFGIRDLAGNLVESFTLSDEEVTNLTAAAPPPSGGGGGGGGNGGGGGGGSPRPTDDEDDDDDDGGGGGGGGNPRPTVSVEGSRALESAGAVVFAVRLSAASSSAVTVDYATSDGAGSTGATAGTDYTATTGTLTFPAGSTAAGEIRVPVTDDMEDEEAETFTLTLRNLGNGLFAGGRSQVQVTGTILDDDDPVVSFGSSSYEVPEGGTVQVSVELSGVLERKLTIPLVGMHQGGATDADYSGVPASVTFSSGTTTREFQFSATEDSDEDYGESVLVGFGDLPSGVSGDGGTTVSIRDDDTPPMAAIDVVGAACNAELCRAVTGQSVRFVDTSSGPAEFLRWDFGDGTQSSLEAPDHGWSAPGFYEVTLRASDGTRESTASRTFLVEASVPAGTCEADAETRCLQDSRYSVVVDWWNGAGKSGSGRVVHAGTNDSGLFRFFDRDNWEVLIKVLDGCALNGHAWVFGASTTDLGYTIRVMDTVTGAVKEYRNEPGLPAPAITDGRAFAESCRR